MPSTYINYTTTTDLNTIEEFEDFINDRWVQHDLLMLLTHKHENDIAQLDEGTDVAITFWQSFFTMIPVAHLR